MTTTTEKQEALDRLTEILEELSMLGDEAESLIGQFFPNRLPAVQAYEACKFGTSSNPYDTTLESIVESINKSMDGEEDEEDEDDD